MKLPNPKVCGFLTWVTEERYSSSGYHEGGCQDPLGVLRSLLDCDANLRPLSVHIRGI